MYEMTPVRLSWRRTYVNFTDAMVESMSSLRHIDRIVAPVTVAYGSLETPDFQRQNREFAAALRAAGKPVDLIEGQNYTHSAMCESLGHPYGPAGRAALAMMKLAPV
jgi:arylformamidase